ncbi:MAG: hypothetical protein F4Z35_03815 [Dehalococcoidia bacterium]|nr:hypothetical protein [Dehalococcoidia bacterium]
MPSWLTPTGWADPDVIRYTAWVSVWGRGLIWLVIVVQFAYRPGFWYHEGHFEYLFLPVPFVTLNALVHYRLLTNRSVTWRWMFLLSAMDMATFTIGIVLQRGFEGFLFLAYYPALVLFVMAFPSLVLGLAWTTMNAVVYALVSLRVGLGLDLVAGDEKDLLARVAAMYVLVLCVSFIVRFERIRRQAAVERERHLQRERIELSQAIHDTTAQTAYMIGLGIHRARELAGESNEELNAALDATSTLSKSAMWELRRPIDEGRLFEGRELQQVLWSHCATFERITSVPAKVSQSGTEPPLAMETRSRLFSIAHNALTNAFLHARPGRVDVRLDFEPDSIRLSVSDDGVGLPDDYAERGRGFNGMRTDAERMGGMLVVENSGGGTTITCVVPRAADRGG